MGAGFGHTYIINGQHKAALEFGNDINCNRHADSCDCMTQHFNGLYDALSQLKTLNFTFKNYTLTVPLTVESTYHGDGYCLVPKDCDVLTLYTDEIANNRDEDLVNWVGVIDAATNNQFLVRAFETALCQSVKESHPDLLVRERICGWCGTAWQSLDEFINGLT